jgi:hypothetical protein
MLLILAFGVWLGWRVNRAREQREAVAAVKRHGGWVHYDWEFVNGKRTPGGQPWAPRWLRRVLGDEYFQEVRHVSLVYDDSTGTRYDNHDQSPCDDVLALLANQYGLRSLLMHGAQATDEGLRHVGRMSGLEELYLWDATSVTDAGVARLANLGSLENIHIGKSNITDSSLVLLSGLPGMKTLSLQNNHFSDDGLARLKRKGRIKQLVIGIGDNLVTDAGLAHLKGCRNLELLDLQNSRVTGRGLEQLKGLTTLKQLWLSGTSVTDADVQCLREAIPNLKVSR